MVSLENMLSFSIFIFVMTQNKEENKNQLTLYDVIYRNLPTESNKSTVGNPASRIKVNSGVRCTYKGGKKRSIIRFSKGQKQLPRLECMGRKTQHSRMYESVVLSKENESPFTYKKVFLSEIKGKMNHTGRGKSSLSPQGMIHTRKLTDLTMKETNIKRIKGYEGKKIRLKKQKNEMTQMFRSYQRFNSPQLNDELVKNLRQDIINSEGKRFKLLRQL